MLFDDFIDCDCNICSLLKTRVASLITKGIIFFLLHVSSLLEDDQELS